MPSGGFECHGCGAKGGNVLDFHCKRYKLSFKVAAKALGAWEEKVPSATLARAPSRHLRRTPAKEAAKRFAGRLLNTGYKPEALHEYRDECGTTLYWMIRAKHPKTGEKWIRPMHFTEGRFKLKLPKFEPGKKPLYGLDLIAAFPGEVVLLCEGEKCADALRKLELVAITSGGATSANNADWSPLAGRQVIIWPDHDEPGLRYASDVIGHLNGIECATEIIDTARLGLDEGGDAVDWLKTHPNATKEAILDLARRGNADTAAVEPTTAAPGDALSDADLRVIARWSSERCVINPRAWGGITSLYRDLCDWCGPDYAFAPGEFVKLLNHMGIRADETLAEGLLLVRDLDGMEGLLT